MLGAGPRILWNCGYVHLGPELHFCLPPLTVLQVGNYNQQNSWGSNLRLAGPAKMGEGDRSQLSVQGPSVSVALMSGQTKH